MFRDTKLLIWKNDVWRGKDSFSIKPESFSSAISFFIQQSWYFNANSSNNKCSTTQWVLSKREKPCHNGRITAKGDLFSVRELFIRKLKETHVKLFFILFMKEMEFWYMFNYRNYIGKRYVLHNSVIFTCVKTLTQVCSFCIRIYIGSLQKTVSLAHSGHVGLLINISPLLTRQLL